MEILLTPCLAICTGPDNCLLSEQGFAAIKNKDIVIMSKPKDPSLEGVHVSYLSGERESYFTKNEKEYSPLPKGFKITIIQ